MTITLSPPVAVDPRTLTPHPENPNVGDVGRVRESIQANGFYGVIVRQKSTGYILAGHTRTTAAIAEKVPEVLVQDVDVNDTEARQILAGDNRFAELARRDPEKLVALLDLVRADAGDLTAAGYTAAEFSDLAAELEAADPEPVRAKPAAEPKFNLKDGTATQVDATRRILVLDLPVDRFAWLVEQLAVIRAQFNVESNAAAVMRLVSETTSSPIPRSEETLDA